MKSRFLKKTGLLSLLGIIAFGTFAFINNPSTTNYNTTWTVSEDDLGDAVENTVQDMAESDILTIQQIPEESQYALTIGQDLNPPIAEKKICEFDNSTHFRGCVQAYFALDMGDCLRVSKDSDGVYRAFDDCDL